MVLTLLVISGCKPKKEVTVTPVGITAKDIYEQAKKFMKRSPEKARLLFKEVMQLYPSSVYARLGKIGIADSFFKERGSSSLVMAAAEYQDYVNLYPQSPDASYASYRVGVCYLRQTKKPGRDQSSTGIALKHFENMIKQFPGTKEAAEAKKHITKCRHNLASHTYKIGVANFRMKAFPGAITRFKEVMDKYPEFTAMDKNFYYAGRTYFIMDDYDLALSFFQRVMNNYPKSKLAKKAQKMARAAEKAKKTKKIKRIPPSGDKK